MGGLVSRNGAERFEDFVAFDLGPPLVAEVPVHSVYTLESMLVPGHFIRHRDGELWADERVKDLTELYAFDASFALEPGLLGYACSFRSTNFPLQYIRHRDTKVYINEYDGSESLRVDATFQLRRAESLNGAQHPLLVCVTLASSPGKYLCVNKDNRVVLAMYQHINHAAYTFRLLPGLALSWDADIGEPLCFDVAPEPLPSGGEIEETAAQPIEAAYDIKVENGSHSSTSAASMGDQASVQMVGADAGHTFSLPSEFTDEMELAHTRCISLSPGSRWDTDAGQSKSAVQRAPSEFSAAHTHWQYSNENLPHTAPRLMMSIEFEAVD